MAYWLVTNLYQNMRANRCNRNQHKSGCG
ncbi:hypothetical protein FFHJCLDM_00510 [Escherichia coli BL21]|nr:hypothetical protein FFHJCLDM_00510 [Escherichia coli BL21]